MSIEDVVAASLSLIDDVSVGDDDVFTDCDFDELDDDVFMVSCGLIVSSSILGIKPDI